MHPHARAGTQTHTHMHTHTHAQIDSAIELLDASAYYVGGELGDHLRLQVGGALAATTAPWPRRWPTPYAPAGGQSRRPSIDTVMRVLDLAITHDIAALRRWGVCLYRSWEHAAASVPTTTAAASSALALARVGRDTLLIALGGDQPGVFGTDGDFPPRQPALCTTRSVESPAFGPAPSPKQKPLRRSVSLGGRA